jgi:hypothetical protein
MGHYAEQRLRGVIRNDVVCLILFIELVVTVANLKMVT